MDWPEGRVAAGLRIIRNMGSDVARSVSVIDSTRPAAFLIYLFVYLFICLMVFVVAVAVICCIGCRLTGWLKLNPLKSRPGSRAVLEHFQSSSRAVPEHFQGNISVIAALFQSYFNAIAEECQNDFSAISELFSAVSGQFQSSCSASFFRFFKILKNCCFQTLASRLFRLILEDGVQDGPRWSKIVQDYPRLFKIVQDSWMANAYNWSTKRLVLHNRINLIELATGRLSRPLLTSSDIKEPIRKWVG